MEQLNENGSERQVENTSARRPFNKRILIAVIALVVLIAGVILAISGLSVDKRIMAPGPIGSTDSVAKPLT